MLKEKIYQKDLGNCTKFLENLQNDNNTNFEEYNYQSVIIKIKNSDKLKMYAIVAIILLFISKYHTLHHQYTILVHDNDCQKVVIYIVFPILFSIITIQLVSIFLQIYNLNIFNDTFEIFFISIIQECLINEAIILFTFSCEYLNNKKTIIITFINIILVLLFIISSGLYYEAIKRYKKNSGCEEWIKFEESIGEYLCISIIYITTAIQTWNMGWNVKKYKNEINLT